MSWNAFRNALQYAGGGARNLNAARARGVCVGTDDPEKFFPEVPGGGQPAAGEIAKAFCRRCDERPRCLAGALDLKMKWGVFGGLTADERRRAIGQWDSIKREKAAEEAARAAEVLAWPTER